MHSTRSKRKHKSRKYDTYSEVSATSSRYSRKHLSEDEPLSPKAAVEYDYPKDDPTVKPMKWFDPYSMYPYSSIFIIGPKGTGKTTIMRYLIEFIGASFDLCVGFNPTEASNQAMKKMCCAGYIHRKFDPVVLRRLIETNEALIDQTRYNLEQAGFDKKARAKVKREYQRLFLIFDDCFEDRLTVKEINDLAKDDDWYRKESAINYKFRTNRIIAKLTVNGRHKKTALLATTQSVMFFDKSQRANCNIAMLTMITDEAELEATYQVVAKPFFDNVNIFRAALAQYTADHHVMVILVNAVGSSSTKFEDCVFRFKAEPLPDRRFAKKIFRDISDLKQKDELIESREREIRRIAEKGFDDDKPMAAYKSSTKIKPVFPIFVPENPAFKPTPRGTFGHKIITSGYSSKKSSKRSSKSVASSKKSYKKSKRSEASSASSSARKERIKRISDTIVDDRRHVPFNRFGRVG